MDFSVPPSLVQAQTRETLDSLHVSLLRLQNESRSAETANNVYARLLKMREKDDIEELEDENDGFAFDDVFDHPADADFGQPQRRSLYREKRDNVKRLVDIKNWPSKRQCDSYVKVRF